jgi:hypothetical protein
MQQQVTMQDVKDAIARAQGPEADGAAGYARLSQEAKRLFQQLDEAERQNMLGNLSERDRAIIVGGRRRRTSKKSRRRRLTRRRR